MMTIMMLVGLMAMCNLLGPEGQATESSSTPNKPSDTNDYSQYETDI